MFICRVKIYQALYGGKNVTPKFKREVANNKYKFKIDNDFFKFYGRGGMVYWEGKIKPFSILYQLDDGFLITKTYLQGDEIDLLADLDIDHLRGGI